ncbi:MAG: OST-HTH/LOTUS domain-containing protein, partial [Demequina sp.]
GLMAYGFGQRKTPKPFVAACTQFVYVENLGDTEAAPEPKETPAFKKDAGLDKLLSEAVDAASGDDGWAQLGTVGSNLSRLASDFDTRTWGYAKLKDLMEAHPSYEMTARKAGEGKQENAYVRKAPRKRSR